ncbi:MAG: hypothetical protein N3C12_03825 [Candidatus Binatia bacterium]|nr:hypothetical protein [Candidatus Binatia bacterium]
MRQKSFSSLCGADRAQALCDTGSLRTVWARQHSPLILATGRIFGKETLLALLDGHVRGGTLGVEEATALTQFLRGSLAAAEPSSEWTPLILGLDTGGVRVEEGPRALAATSAAGVLLAERSLRGGPTIAFISGPRGCFGAPAVMAALPDRLVMMEGTHWGLTGPKLFSAVDPEATETEGLQTTSAAERRFQGDVSEVLPDNAQSLREALGRCCEELQGLARVPLVDRVQQAAEWLRERQRRWAATGERPAEPRRRRRDLLRYSFRGQWRPTEAVAHGGLVQAAWGILEELPALGIIVGPAADERGGIGIVEATTIVEKLRTCAGIAPPAHAIVANFVFCQGHIVDLKQERFGLPKVLAECLRAYVATRLSGHTIFTVLGGGTYGAAYLSLAAPSHRIFAIRGTQLAPMAPAVLKAFRSIRGTSSAARGEQAVAEWIPEVTLVDSVIRLPRVLKAALEELRKPKSSSQRTCAA